MWNSSHVHGKGVWGWQTRVPLTRALQLLSGGKPADKLDKN